MLFNSLDFLVFLTVVLAIYWSLNSINKQNYFLLAGSLFFYGYADWKFLSLIIACALTGYIFAIAIERCQARKKLFLVLGIVIPFGILFVFKYFDFFFDSVDSIMHTIGLPFHKTTLRIVLPIGISFFTFQTVGYLVDVYRGKHKAEKDFLELLLFISFFPQLVAGPIERIGNLMPQIKNRRTVNNEDIHYGVFLILQGLVKKMVIADNLAPIVNSLFEYNNLSGPLVLVGLLAFAIQIYGDFSGYTDIARGTARLLGFKLIRNFDHPYMSLSPTEFWRRWHMSLSNWYRDYLYIPLGGSRKGVVKTYINIMITWILCGLWHGASFNFIFWGGFHGILLIIHKLYRNVTEGAGFTKSKTYSYMAWVVTFIAVLYGWMLFRVTDMSQIWRYSKALVMDWSAFDLGVLTFTQIFPFVFLMICIDYFESKFLNVIESRLSVRWAMATYFTALLLISSIFISDSSGDFIYFKF